MNPIDDPLDELLENVNSKADFLNFIQALSADKLDEVKQEKANPSSPHGSGANGWENGSIKGFLEAVSRYGQDSKSISENPNWKDFALLLYAGKFYEQDLLKDSRIHTYLFHERTFSSVKLFVTLAFFWRRMRRQTAQSQQLSA